MSEPQARSRISSEKRVYQASTANRNQRRGHPRRRNAMQASAREWLSLHLPTFTRRKAICSGYPAPPVGTREESTELPGSKSLTSRRRGAQDREAPAESVKGARDFNDDQFFETVSRNHGHLLEVFCQFGQNRHLSRRGEGPRAARSDAGRTGVRRETPGW